MSAIEAARAGLPGARHRLEAQHRYSVPHRRKCGGGHPGDALRGRVRGDEVGVRLLERHELGAEPVVLHVVISGRSST
jgi:hypothetical protein